jgi:hypothetical protein
LKTATPPTPVTLNDASLRSCFALVVKMHTLSEPWRRVIAKKVRKRTWELLDEFGETVLDTVDDIGDTKISDLWGKWLKHPNVSDYKNAMDSDLKRKATRDEKDQQLKESPMRKKLRDAAYGSMINQGHVMKKAAQAQSSITTFAVGSIVQVPLHDVDTTKADGKNLTLVVVEVVKRKDSSCPMYRLACNAGVLDTLYHPSYMTAVQSTSTVLGLNSIIDEWTGLPKIKERKAAASVSMVGGQGKHLGCGCKSGTCRTGRCACFKAGLTCTSKCHGGINKNCVNKE